jgi:CBS domain containing-hemolysin-like protein
MEPFHYVIIIILTILFSAIFTGVEIAMLSMWKMQLEIDVSSDSYLIKLKKAIRLNPEKYIATIVTGNYFSFVLCTVAFVGLLSPFFENLFALKLTTLVLIVLISAITILLLGKLIPRAIFTFLPNQFLSVFLILLSFFSFMLYPFTRLILFLTNIFGKSNQTTDLSNPLFNRIESNWFINKSSFNRTNKQENVEAEVKLFKNALDFSKVKLREIMVPRTEIEVLDLNSSMEELRQKFVETGFSRIIFYDENVDNIVGYVHSSVIFKNPESFKPFINDVLIVPETMPANKLLSTFIREHRSIAIVVDEFGGTSGMVTSEDILEEIFGEIEDEHDTNDIIENRISDTEFIFSGRSEIDLINEKYQINLPETEDFETLAGYILFHHESIPKINTVIKIGVFQFKILKATNTRIELVKLTIEDD